MAFAHLDMATSATLIIYKRKKKSDEEEARASPIKISKGFFGRTCADSLSGFAARSWLNGRYFLYDSVAWLSTAKRTGAVR